MVRNYKRQTERAKASLQDYGKAAIEVQSERCSFGKAEIMFNVTRMSLLRFF